MLKHSSTCNLLTPSLYSTVTSDDAIYVVWEKTKRLTDRILEGKSVAVALGDLNNKPQEEQELKNLTLKENHHWQLWKYQKGELPPMQWQADRDEHPEQQGQNNVDRESDQHAHGKRKSSSRGTGQVEQQRRVKKRNGDEASPVTLLDVEALGEIYRLSPEMKAKVVEADVRYFRRMYAPLKPLLSAMVKTLQARFDLAQAATNRKTEDELRLTELQSTQKAIYTAEKQAKWIYEETASAYAQIQEQISIMRGRLSALGGHSEEEEEDDDMEAVSSSASSPVSKRGDDIQDLVEQDVTKQTETIEAIVGTIMVKEQTQPPPSSASKQSGSKQVSQHQSDTYSDHTIRSEEAVNEAVGSMQGSNHGEPVEYQPPAATYHDAEAAVSDEENSDQEWSHLYNESVSHQLPAEVIVNAGQTMAGQESKDARIGEKDDDDLWNETLPEENEAETKQVEEQQQADARAPRGSHTQPVKSADDYRSPMVPPTNVQQAAPPSENAQSSFWLRYGLQPLSTARPTRPSTFTQNAPSDGAAGQGALHPTASAPHTSSQPRLTPQEGVQFGSCASRSFFAQ